MQFFENGPDIPNALLQEHEEGRVIFFAVRVYFTQQVYRGSKCSSSGHVRQK
jgi:hypothetical protein